MKKIIAVSFIVISSLVLFGCKNQNSDVEPVQNLPTSCVDEDQGLPVITYISSNSGTIDSQLEIQGCNFSGFEGDKNIWIENENGVKGIIYGTEGSDSKSIKFTLKYSICQNDNSYSGMECENVLELVPGKYKIFVMPWGKLSNKVDFTINQSSSTKMTEAEAKIIAEQTCIKGGETISPLYYNENTKTWWFDANLNATKPGCNPACVVSETTKTAEINWRCTGLIVPENNSLDELTSVFKEKYQKYSETLKVIIKMEVENLVRGDIIFETGAPGGIFLATKIDGKWKIVHEGNGAISCSLKDYGFGNDMLYDCVNVYNYQDLMDYIDKNITEILDDYPDEKPANGKWFADGYGFTSINDVYVDFEDGHFMYRALLNCNNTDGEFSCSPSAIFEKEKDWKLVKGVDTVKDFPIIYSKAVDYEWKR